jgi:hypothetical protein
LLPDRIIDERTDAGWICSTLLDKYPEGSSTAMVDTFKAKLNMWTDFGKKKARRNDPTALSLYMYIYIYIYI